MTTLVSIAATVQRAYLYGGIVELLGCAKDGAKNLLLPHLAALFGLKAQHEFWPSWSPELLLHRPYRAGRWSIDGLTTPVVRCADLVNAMLSKAAPPPLREGAFAPDGFGVPHRGTARWVPYQASAGDRNILQEAFRQHYGAPQLALSGADEATTWRLDFRHCDAASISIIIPTRDHASILKACIASIDRMHYKHAVELIIIDNGSCEPATHEWFDTLRARSNTRIISADMPFNWSRLNNIGAQAASGEVLLFLNNDIEVISETWLDTMIGLARAPNVGCVGPMLLYPDGTIQHAGVVLGMGRWADHIYKGVNPEQLAEHLPFVPPTVTRPVTALTGACLAITQQKFAALGRFDESMQVIFSDVELCLRAHRRGYRNIFCADERLYHFESKSRDSKRLHISDFRRARTLLQPFRTEQCDPYFHPRLDKLSLIPKSDLLPGDLSRWLRLWE